MIDIDSPQSVADLVARWPSRGAFASDLGCPVERAKGWVRRGSIPVEYWPAVIAAARRRGFPPVTPDLLMRLCAGLSSPDPVAMPDNSPAGAVSAGGGLSVGMAP